MKRFPVLLRLLATLAVVGAVAFSAWLRVGPSAAPLALTIVSPAPGTTLPVGEPIHLVARLTGGPARRIVAGKVKARPDGEGRVTLVLPAPKKPGIHAVALKARLEGGGHVVFHRAWLAAGPVSPSAADGYLVLPEAFFRPGGSNLISTLDDELNMRLVPEIQKSLVGHGTEVVDHVYFHHVHVRIHARRISVRGLRVALTPEPRMDGAAIRVRLDFKGLTFDGSIAASLESTRGFLAHLEDHLPSIKIHAKLSGDGGASAVVRLVVPSPGKLEARVAPKSLDVRVEHVCDDRICFGIEPGDLIQRWLRDRLRRHVPEMLEMELTKLFDAGLKKLRDRVNVAGVPLVFAVEPVSADIDASGAVRLGWRMTFPESSGETPTASWAGAVPSWPGGRAHMLVSDRLLNRVFTQLWLEWKKRGIPTSWLVVLRRAVATSGYTVTGISLGLPPVLAPGPGKDGLELQLGDVHVVLTRPGKTELTLLLQAKIPVRVVPNAANTALNLIAGWSAAEVSSAEGKVEVECLKRVDKSGAVTSGSSETERFQSLAELAFALSGGVRKAIEIPIPTPSVPGPQATTESLRITRAQLVPNAPGWFVLETSY